MSEIRPTHVGITPDRGVGGDRAWSSAPRTWGSPGYGDRPCPGGGHSGDHHTARGAETGKHRHADHRDGHPDHHHDAGRLNRGYRGRAPQGYCAASSA